MLKSGKINSNEEPLTFSPIADKINVGRPLYYLSSTLYPI